MPSGCATSSNGEYAVRHNPPPYYSRLSTGCSTHDVGIAAVSCPTSLNTTCSSPGTNAFTSDLTNDTLPTYVFVTPNLINDMHDGSVSQGDNWLHTYLPKVLKSAAYLRGEVAVYILWDEQGSFSAGPIPNVFVSPYIQPKVSSTTMNLFAALRAAENQLGKSHLGCASGTPPGGVGTCPSGSTANLRSIFNF
jgi:acid phosphatase